MVARVAGDGENRPCAPAECRHRAAELLRRRVGYVRMVARLEVLVATCTDWRELRDLEVDLAAFRVAVEGCVELAEGYVRQAEELDQLASRQRWLVVSAARKARGHLPQRPGLGHDIVPRQAGHRGALIGASRGMA